MSPIKQLERHLRERGDEYANEFANFARNVITNFNKEYCDRKREVFRIHTLMYNVKTSTYEYGIIPQEKEDGRVKVISTVAHHILGIKSPLYCVGYCVSADGYVSHYNVEGTNKEEREEILNLAKSLGPDEDPLSKEMVIYNVVSLTGVKMMDFYEIDRKDGVSVRQSGFPMSKGHMEGEFTDIFEIAQRSFEQLVEEHGFLSGFANKNIFE